MHTLSKEIFFIFIGKNLKIFVVKYRDSAQAPRLIKKYKIFKIMLFLTLGSTLGQKILFSFDIDWWKR